MFVCDVAVAAVVVVIIVVFHFVVQLLSMSCHTYLLLDSMLLGQ